MWSAAVMGAALAAAAAGPMYGAPAAPAAFRTAVAGKVRAIQCKELAVSGRLLQGGDGILGLLSHLPSLLPLCLCKGAAYQQEQGGSACCLLTLAASCMRCDGLLLCCAGRAKVSAQRGGHGVVQGE